MILRRFIEHVEAQNWFAIGIDFLIVVVGVFVGIQVSNWNAERIERLQEKELLVRLHEDFVASEAGQRRDLNFLGQQLADQAVILNSLNACDVRAADAVAFQRGIVTLGYINPPRFYRRTVDELASAGRTDTIRNETIKDRLADIVALVEWRSNGYESTARTSEHHRFILEDRIRYDPSTMYADQYIGQHFGVQYDIHDLCRNPSIFSAVSAISWVTAERARAYGPILANYEAFLPLLEQELRDRWRLDIAVESAQ